MLTARNKTQLNGLDNKAFPNFFGGNPGFLLERVLLARIILGE
jgi:hypothetical protein